MSSPLETPEFRDSDENTPDGLYVGDFKDDDGQVIDSFLIETNAPPIPVTEAIHTTPLVQPVRYGRLYTGSMIITAALTIAPQRILPADAKRKSISISAFSLAAAPEAFNEYAQVADENGMSTAASGAYRLRHGKDPLVLTDYTGPIYVFPSSTMDTLGMEISWIAVTQ